MQQEAQEHRQRAQRIETLLQEIATFSDSHARVTTEELVQILLDLYGEGLAHILELTNEHTSNPLLIEAFAKDEVIAPLLVLHGLYPVEIETRIMQALDEVRPYLKSHGGNVEFLKVEDGIAYLRLEGSCHGCPSSTVTLKTAIEEAIYKAAPDLDGLQVEGDTDLPPSTGVRSGSTMPVTFVAPRRKQAQASAQDAQNSLPDRQALEASASLEA